MQEMDRHHWLERCSLQDEHWDQSPWPAQLVQLPAWESGSCKSDDDEPPPRMVVQRHRRATTGRSDSRPVRPAVVERAASSPQHHRRRLSHPRLGPSSLADSDEALRRVHSRRHSRIHSAPEPAAERLHIDTLLPLELPPSNLCTLSPLLAYPCTWWSAADSPEVADVARSESLISMISADSNGSWHGDGGDEDPDGQLDQAIHRMSSVAKVGPKDEHKEGLESWTFDYEEEADLLASTVDDECKSDDGDGDAIRSHAGPLMNNVVRLFLEFQPSVGSLLQKQPQPHARALMGRSFSDSGLLGHLASPGQLDDENRKLQRTRRVRSATSPPMPTTGSAADPSLSALSSFWQWLMPTIDEQFQNELFGYPRNDSPRLRNDSVPSLSSGSVSSSERDTSEQDEDEDEGADQWYSSDVPLDGRTSSDKAALHKLTLASMKRIPVTATSGTPSPLWDNRWVEEPYERSWSSVLGLSSM